MDAKKVMQYAFGILVIITIVFFWYFQVHLNGFGVMLMVIVVLTIEGLHIGYRVAAGEKIEYSKYLIVFAFLASVYLADDYWRDFGATAGYFFGVTAQQVVFFIFMPGWLSWSLSKKNAFVVCALYYWLVHLPNMPLIAVTCFGGVIFSWAYYRFGWIMLFGCSPVHCILGSYLHESWGRGWDMCVGLKYLKHILI